MPTRFLKESICGSDDIEKLSWFEEVLFYRLIVNCDDFGRFDGRPLIIKSRLFPLKDRLTVKEVSSALSHLASIGIVRMYMSDNKPYLYLPSWEVHQSVRAKSSKYPAPDMTVQADENKCNQMQADVTDIRNSYSYSDFDNRNSDDSSEQASEPEKPAANEENIVFLTLNDNSKYGFSQSKIDFYAKTYPNVDILQQFRQMEAWGDANKAKRKTINGINKFVNAWLAREQDKPTYQEKNWTGNPKLDLYKAAGARGELSERDLENIRRMLQEE